MKPDYPAVVAAMLSDHPDDIQPIDEGMLHNLLAGGAIGLSSLLGSAQAQGQPALPPAAAQNQEQDELVHEVPLQFKVSYSRTTGRELTQQLQLGIERTRRRLVKYVLKRNPDFFANGGFVRVKGITNDKGAVVALPDGRVLYPASVHTKLPPPDMDTKTISGTLQLHLVWGRRLPDGRIVEISSPDQVTAPRK